MPIVVEPNQNVTGVVGLPVCFSASANVVIPQEDQRYADLPASGTNWTWQGTFPGIWKRTGGTSGDFESAIGTVATPVYGLQPFQVAGINYTFETPASPNRFYAAQWGVVDDQDRWYAWYLWKNCGSQSTLNCSGPNTDNSRWEARVLVNNTVVATFFVNYREEFRVRSDGTRLHWDWKTGNVWQLSKFTIDLPVSDNFRFRVKSAYNNNEVYGLTTFKASYIGSVPTTWTAPLGGTITGSGNNRCFTADVAGSYQVCVDSEFDDPVCVDVEVSALYFIPEDFDCGDCTFVNTVVRFLSNGGLSGVLTATGGTVIDALTWQAPSEPGSYVLTYTVGGFSVDCTINVIPEFKALNVVGGVIKGLLPGESFKILTNYDAPFANIEWENVDCKNIVMPDGTIVIPRPSVNNCFGALRCSVRARVTEILEYPTCDNLDGIFLDFLIEVDPVFPTPEFGGPNYVKWKTETPDYRVIVNEFEGGCDETYIRNKVPVQKWQVRYAGLLNEVPCTPEPCCDEPLGYVGGFDPSFQAAARLDEFWNLVYGQYGYFTLVEPRTGRVWERVRFDGTMERDHINWRTTQSREFTLAWRPCCETEPAGGTCPHLTIIRDIIAPYPPQAISAGGINDNTVLVQWKKAQDNIGIKGYQLEVDGVIVDVGHVFVYYHRGLSPSTEHTYRVRAYDFSSNFSAWSAPATAALFLSVVESGDLVQEGGDQVIEE